MAAWAVRFFANLAHHFLDIFDREIVFVAEETEQQQAVADRVDPAWNAAAGLEDGLERARFERGTPCGPRAFEPVLDVALCFFEVERPDVAGCDHALTQLLHRRALQDLPEFRLPDQKALQKRLFAELEIRQHAQLFDGSLREVLGLVDDQQATFTLLRLGDEKHFQGHQQIGLRHVARSHAESRTDHAQGVFGIQLGADQLGGHHLAGVQALEQAPNDRGLAGADFARDDDEALVAEHAVLEVSLGALMLLAAEIKGRIGVELKRLARQPIVGFVHGQNWTINLPMRDDSL